jgi:DNA-binding NtrC family response regulator
VNTRIVAATNRPLSDMVSRGLFRTDLYYRLGGVEIHVPPLRARREDISELATYFLARHSKTRDLSLSDAAIDALRMYTWPGNVRELERFIERAVALTESNHIELDDLPPQLRGEYLEVLGPSMATGESMRAWGSRYARLVFERCGRNKRRACRLLDISYHTLEAYLRYTQQDVDERRQLPAWARSVSAGTDVPAAATVHEGPPEP